MYRRQEIIEVKKNSFVESPGEIALGLPDCGKAGKMQRKKESCFEKQEKVAKMT